MKLLNRLKVFEQKYVFLRWAMGAEYGKIVYVGEDYMEFKETVMINSQLLLEVIFGGSDISRIVAEISSMLSEG